MHRTRGSPLPPPFPASHSDPRKEDEVEDPDSGKCREEEANADAIVTLVVAIVAAKLVTSRLSKVTRRLSEGVVVTNSTIVIVVFVQVEVV